MKQKFSLIVLAFLLSSVSFVFGQNKFAKQQFEQNKTYIIELIDNTQFVGYILQNDSLSIVIKTETIPKIEIPIQKIKRIEEIIPSRLKNGEYWFPNPNSTRYLFGPSAFTLKKGEGYYQNTYLIVNSFNFGITDHISMGAGLEFISTFGSLASGTFQPIFFITPKIGYQITEKFHAGAGVLYATLPGFFDEDNRSSFGIAYGIGTYGTPDHNITGGLGWGFFNGEFSDKPIITLSGMTRIGRRVALVTENWIIPADDYYGIITYGIRFFGEKMTVDFAFINNGDIAQALILGIPYVDFVVKF